MESIITAEYYFVVNKKVEIKKGDKFLADNVHIITCKGNSSKSFINNNFYRSKCAKIIAYYPLNKEVKEFDLPLLPDPFKEEIDTNVQTRNFNKQVKNPYSNYDKEYQIWERAYIEGFDDGVSQDKQFSLNDIKKAFEEGWKCKANNGYKSNGSYYEDENKFLQSLSTQQLPKEFIPTLKGCMAAMDTNICDNCDNSCKELKTITNSEGRKVLVGTYKY